jgi:AraC family transcriptional regulator
MPFSHISSGLTSPEMTLPPPVEAAFAIHVHHQPLLPLETWIGGTHAYCPTIGTGGMCFFDLRASPVALVTQPLDFSRLYFKSATVAYHRGISGFDLSIAPFGHDDPIIYSLALALKSRLATYGEETDSVFADSVALALIERFLSAYAGAIAEGRERTGLSATEYRRQMEYLDVRMSCPLSLSELASVVNMPPARFAKAFKRTTGIPVYRWLMIRRVEKAKDLLRSTNPPISVIAIECGFVDQSHLGRVLKKHLAMAPTEWRATSRN